MPKIFSLDKYLSSYFRGSIKLEDDGIEHTFASIIGHFFSSIHFTTPRHIKKVLNKYEILKVFKNNPEVPHEIRNMIPNILTNDGKGCVFQTIFCLFFIIIYENHLEEFTRIENYKRKLSNYIKPYINANPSMNDKSISNGARIVSMLDLGDIKSLKLTHHFNNPSNINSFFYQFILIFSTDKIETFDVLHDSQIDKYDTFFKDDGILTLFCKFLIKHQKSLIKNHFGDYKFGNYFDMAKYLL